MTGKSGVLAFALGAGLLMTSLPAGAAGGKVQILYGLPAAEALSVSPNEGGTRVTIVRGSPAAPAAAEATAPMAAIGGEKVQINNLEPTGNWFLDRSGENLVIVHCYTQQSLQVGGGRRILCDAREL